MLIIRGASLKAAAENAEGWLSVFQETHCTCLVDVRVVPKVSRHRPRSLHLNGTGDSTERVERPEFLGIEAETRAWTFDTPSVNAVE